MTIHEAKSKQYYDEFSNSYEKHRHHGYHVLIDNLEVELVKRYAGEKILEAGCGTGLILQRLTQFVPQAIGIDLSAGMLSHAHKRGLNVFQSSVDTLPFADNSFDTVVSFKVLAHVPNIKKTLQELSRVTKPGGHLLLEFYNRYSLRTLIKHMKRPSKIGKKYQDTDVYTRYDSLKDIKSYLPPNLQFIDLRGVRVFTPFAKAHELPILAKMLNTAEQKAADAFFLKNFGGFMIVILKKIA